jgi:hypothetical protein
VAVRSTLMLDPTLPAVGNDVAVHVDDDDDDDNHDDDDIKVRQT